MCVICKNGHKGLIKEDQEKELCPICNEPFFKNIKQIKEFVEEANKCDYEEYLLDKMGFLD
jgi:hypothetical protein